MVRVRLNMVSPPQGQAGSPHQGQAGSPHVHTMISPHPGQPSPWGVQGGGENRIEIHKGNPKRGPDGPFSIGHPPHSEIHPHEEGGFRILRVRVVVAEPRQTGRPRRARHSVLVPCGTDGPCFSFHPASPVHLPGFPFLGPTGSRGRVPPGEAPLVGAALPRALENSVRALKRFCHCDRNPGLPPRRSPFVLPSFSVGAMGGHRHRRSHHGGQGVGQWSERWSGRWSVGQGVGR